MPGSEFANPPFEARWRAWPDVEAEGGISEDELYGPGKAFNDTARHVAMNERHGDARRED
jgi:hypothetical protein